MVEDPMLPPDDPDKVIMVVEFEADMRISASVDLVKHFTGIPEAEQNQYFDIDLDQLGFSMEWERPLAWITDALYEDSVGFGSGGLRGGTAGFSDGDIPGFWDIRVKREATPPEGRYGSHYHWTEADFDALAAAVPWLRPPEPPDEEVLARMPGPNDQPLFEET